MEKAYQRNYVKRLFNHQKNSRLYTNRKMANRNYESITQGEIECQALDRKLD